MTKKVAKQNDGQTQPADQDRMDLARAYQEDGAAEQKGGLPLLKLRKGDGIWVNNDEEIQGDRVAVLNMATYARGWIHFEGGEVTDEVWVKPGEARPDESALPQHGPYQNDGDGWQQASRVNLRFIDTGEEYLYSPTSLGGRQALGGVAAQFGYQLAQDPINCVPKVAFMSTSYIHKQFGKVFKPVLRNMGWASNEATIASGTPGTDGDPGPSDADDVPFTL